MLLTNLWFDSKIFAIIISSFLIAGLGLLDDYLNLKPLHKLLGQILGAVILILNGVQINIFDSPEFFFSFGASMASFLNITELLIWLKL